MSRSTANWLLYTPFVIAYVYFVDPRTSGGSALADLLTDLSGLALILAGLGVRIVSREWKTTHVSSGLVSSGPYAVVRNPMYIGSFLVGLGMCVIIGNGPYLIAFTLIYAVVHDLVVRREERFLLQRWPDDYAAYLRSVPRWIPSPLALAEFMRGRKPLAPMRVAVAREMNTICGALIGALALQANEQLVSQGWETARTEVTISLALGAAILLAWIICSLEPVKSRLRRSRA